MSDNPQANPSKQNAASSWRSRARDRRGGRAAKSLRCFVLATALLAASADADLATLKLGIQVALATLGTCAAGDPDTNCNEFVCAALQKAYGAEAAKDLTSSGQCMSADAMTKKLWLLAAGTARPTGPLGWTFIGTAADAGVLERAQACANEGFATIVASEAPPAPPPPAKAEVHGHVVLVVPGKLVNSAAWNAKVPIVAGRRRGVAGTTNEDDNSNEIALSFHWGKGKREAAKVFVEGAHKQDPLASGCQ